MNIVLNVWRYIIIIIIIIIILYHLYAGYLQLHTLNHVYWVYSVAAIRPSQSMAHEFLFPLLKVLFFYIIGPTF